jgi:hypothetical protein
LQCTQVATCSFSSCNGAMSTCANGTIVCNHGC